MDPLRENYSDFRVRESEGYMRLRLVEKLDSDRDDKIEWVQELDSLRAYWACSSRDFV